VLRQQQYRRHSEILDQRSFRFDESFELAVIRPEPKRSRGYTLLQANWIMAIVVVPRVLKLRVRAGHYWVCRGLCEGIGKALSNTRELDCYNSDIVFLAEALCGLSNSRGRLPTDLAGAVEAE